MIQAQLGGFAGERLRRNVRQWINTFDIHRYVGLIENRLPGGGTLAGLWLEAAILACEWAGDALLRQRAMGMLERLLAVEDSADRKEFELLAGALKAAGDVWSNGPAMGIAKFLPPPPPPLSLDENGTEFLIWNRLFAMQTVDGDGFRTDVPAFGWRPEGYYAGPLESDARTALALARVPSLFYLPTEGGVWINHYGESSARVGEVLLRQTTAYPSEGAVRIDIGCKRPLDWTIRLRVPAWCRAPRIAVNGQQLSTFSLRRTWQNGDRIDLDIPMEPRWRKGTGENEGLVAFERGPLRYFGESGTEIRPGRVRELPAQTPESLGPDYELVGTGIRLRPLANLGEWYRSDDEKSRWLESIASHPDWAGDPIRSRIHPFTVWHVE